jgi:glycosyltransferase involved in cell wall biosynthesis
VEERKICVLFSNWADEDNFNAQSLNARALALRLPDDRFHSTLFYGKSPDPRLVGRPSIRLLRIPRRGGTFRMLLEALRCDIIFRANLNRFAYLYWHIPEKFRRHTAMVDWVEAYVSPSLDRLPPWPKKFSDYIMPRISYRACITEYVARKIRDHHGLGFQRIIPVGVERRFFEPFPRRRRERPGVLFVGHLIERKGPQFVLQAARLFPRAQFILVGERRGNYYRELFRMVEDWKLENVIFRPPMNHEDLFKLMQESDILLHPSLTEGFPKVVLEGAAAALPAVIFDYYGAPGLVDGRTGFATAHFEEMAARLGLLLEDRALRERMGDAAREHVRQFDWDLVARQWVDFFEDVKNQKVLPLSPGDSGRG